MKLFEIINRCAHADEAVQRNDRKGKLVEDTQPAKKDTAEPSQKPSHKKGGKQKAQSEVVVT